MTEKTQYQFNIDTYPSISKDGLIRLPYEKFKDIPIVHLYSELSNANNSDDLSLSNAKTRLCGLTEWSSIGLNPSLSIGWQWKLNTTNSSFDYQIDSSPFSNIMFIDQNHEDSGKKITEHLLTQYINNFNWSVKVKEYLNEKYS